MKVYKPSRDPIETATLELKKEVLAVCENSCGDVHKMDISKIMELSLQLAEEQSKPSDEIMAKFNSDSDDIWDLICQRRALSS
jgi:hypothetical protein